MSNGEKFVHLATSLQPVAALSDEDRIAHVQMERFHLNPAASCALGHMQGAHDQPPRDRLENVLLTGESAMGKTMIIRQFERQNPVSFDRKSGVQRRSVVVMLMPHQPTEVPFFYQLISALQAPIAAGQWKRVHLLQVMAIKLLRAVGARVLVIDEINSVLVGTSRQRQLFLALLRFLSNELSLALVCVGVPEARRVLMSDVQLESRFNDVELPLWRPGPELQDFVNRVVGNLPLRQPSPVDSPKLMTLLAHRSHGRTLGITKAIERAAVAAIRTGRERIDYSSFTDEVIWHGVAAAGRGARSKSRS